MVCFSLSKLSASILTHLPAVVYEFCLDCILLFEIIMQLHNYIGALFYRDEHECIAVYLLLDKI